MTGGYRAAVLKTTNFLGIDPDRVFANELIHDKNGNFIDLDWTIPLWKPQGKTDIVNQVIKNYRYTTVIIGDGMTDFEAGKVSEMFICFAGVIRRERVANKADHVISNRSLMACLPLLI